MQNVQTEQKSQVVTIRKALVSVSNKDGLAELCQALHAKGVQIYGTEGTAAYLKKSGIEVTRIETVTEFPEMMDGRVKTLHPRIFGGILARRYHAKDLEEAQAHHIPLFDLVVVNLYPFWEHLGKAREEQSAFVDIGGPSLMRAAAKNFDAVTVLSDPDDYSLFLNEFNSGNGSVGREFRHVVAARTFARTSAYDQAIAAEWGKADEIPAQISFPVRETLRYGENPHQKAAWAGSKSKTWKVLQGKELSYNNLLDAEAALRVTAEFEEPAVCIVKHNNPCGVAAANLELATVFTRAFEADSKSAFGGIVSANREIDGATAQAMSAIFLEVVLAPGFTQEALEIFAKKKNLRLIEWPVAELSSVELRAAMGGWLMQTSDGPEARVELKCVTTTPVPKGLESDLTFAWKVAKHVRSNAIVIAKQGVTLGAGGGQTSRVDAVSIALEKARQGKASLKGAVLASDAFFPFRDNIDLLKDTGIAGIIQPGGSQRDAEVIEACNELGIAMVFTGSRHFRH